MILAIGWNGMESHQMPRAPLVLREFSEDPDKLLAVIDPRTSETAKIANIHLALRPGTDALLMKAMIAIILQGDGKTATISKITLSGFEKIEQFFREFDARRASNCAKCPAMTRMRSVKSFRNAGGVFIQTWYADEPPQHARLVSSHNPCRAYAEGFAFRGGM
jgi:anaerobic selenocysteine-containing dehydrogenase